MGADSLGLDERCRHVQPGVAAGHGGAGAERHGYGGGWLFGVFTAHLQPL